MIDIETKVMFGIFCLLLYFSTLKYIVIFLSFWLFVYLFGFFLTSIGVDIDVSKFEENEIFYQEYTGDYALVYNKLSEYRLLKSKYKLPTESFSPFGIFYDDPEVNDKSSCRAIYGIIKHTKDEYKDLKQSLKSEGFKFAILPQVECIVGSYTSLFYIQSTFIFISKLIIEMTTMKFFRRLYHPKWKENKIKIAKNNYRKHCGVIEIVRSDKLDIYVPLDKVNDFFLHSESTIPKRMKKK